MMARFFLIWMISLNALGANLVLTFGELKVIFAKVDGIYVNRSCKNKKCEAFQKYIQFSKKSLPRDLLLGGKNPAAVRCKELMGGEVIIGRDRDGHEQSVCQFRDGSYLI
jgi:hypothetical protein